MKIKTVVADLGFRDVDADNPGKDIIHRGKFKSLNPHQKAWLRRRQAIEPAIRHLKSDHRMDRCWLDDRSFKRPAQGPTPAPKVAGALGLRCTDRRTGRHDRLGAVCAASPAHQQDPAQGPS